MIRLEKVNERTFKRVINMKLPETQPRFVAPNVVSLAQAWLYPGARPFAILDGDEVVGFIMLDWDEEERTVGLWRLMIAPEQQRKGYGRQAMEAAIQMAKDNGNIDVMFLDYVPGNIAARALYYACGFRENGEEDDGEIVMMLPLTEHPKVGMLTADKDDLDDFYEILDKERAAGARIPAGLSDKAVIAAKTEAGLVKRLTVMGKTIGYGIGTELLIQKESMQYYDEAAARFSRDHSLR